MDISFLEVGGFRIAAGVRGAGPLVVCSPAMGDTRDAFRPLADRLVAAGFRVALLDLRGHGDSDAGFDRYGDEATADDLLAAIDAFGEGPAFLAGASMSAAAAVIAAGRRPDAVAGLLLFGPFLRNPAGGRAARLGLRALLLRPWGPMVWRMYSAKLWPGLGDEARTRAAATTKLLTRPGRWKAFQATTRTNHDVVAPWIPKVTAPSLVVMGAADPDWKDPGTEADWIAQELGSEVLVVPGVGHAPMLEAPDVVAPRVLTFLEGAVDAPRRP
jgi:pimeloyl-ACP methyl ester carboxylesterase